jgi:hypothetical protein
MVRAGGWVAQSQVVARPEAGAATLVFELEEAAGMEGEITDERGEPVGGARVVVRSSDGRRAGGDEDDGGRALVGAGLCRRAMWWSRRSRRLRWPSDARACDR